MTTAILAPWAKDEVTRLGQKVFKKEILRFGHVKTDDGEFDFTPEFGGQLIEAFQAGVMGTVPLVLAPGDNSHTQAVDRQGGEVIGLELANDKLIGVIRANDETARLINENPRLGVSIRALQGRLDNDGKRWPAVLNHVLATFDPVVTGMAPWEPVELSNDVTKVIDLANPAGSNRKENSMPKEIAGSLSTEEAEQLHALLGKALGKDGGEGPTDTDDEQRPETDKIEDENEDDDSFDIASLSDEELETLIAEMASQDESETDDDGDGGQSETPTPIRGEVVDGNGQVVETEEQEREPVAASNDNGPAIELARARQEEQAVELARMRQELDAAKYEKERDQLVKRTGLPPRIIDMARPLLEGAGRTVELSNGDKTDAGKVVRIVFDEIGKTLKALDLSNPTGFGMEANEDDEDEKDRAEFVDTVKQQFRLG